MLRMPLRMLTLAALLASCASLDNAGRSFTYMKMACGELPGERSREASRLQALVARQRSELAEVAHVGSVTFFKSPSAWAHDIARSRSRLRAIDLEVAGRCGGRTGAQVAASGGARHARSAAPESLPRGRASTVGIRRA